MHVLCSVLTRAHTQPTREKGKKMPSEREGGTPPKEHQETCNSEKTVSFRGKSWDAKGPPAWCSFQLCPISCRNLAPLAWRDCGTKHPEGDMIMTLSASNANRSKIQDVSAKLGVQWLPLRLLPTKIGKGSTGVLDIPRKHFCTCQKINHLILMLLAPLCHILSQHYLHSWFPAHQDCFNSLSKSHEIYPGWRETWQDVAHSYLGTRSNLKGQSMLSREVRKLSMKASKNRFQALKLRLQMYITFRRFRMTITLDRLPLACHVQPNVANDACALQDWNSWQALKQRNASK